jgi:starch synthase (maltosyl-transferring)
MLNETGRQRVVIAGVTPAIDGGCYPITRTMGEEVQVEADIYTDGHDALTAVLLYRPEQAPLWQEMALEPLVNDRWRGSFTVTQVGWYRYTLPAWIDHFTTWRQGLAKKVAAGQLARLAHRYGERQFATLYDQELGVVVDRQKARFRTWYEMFPRSCAAEPGRHGTLQDFADRLPYIAQMGFGVLYLPPIHAIGCTYRKGKNHMPRAQPDDVGSPWAIGAAAGGHKAVHPALETLEDFRRLVATTRDYGMEIALDIALQCSPDHPYVKAHPLWFRWRPDGTVQYAENPPKEYQDIYPFDFETEDWEQL